MTHIPASSCSMCMMPFKKDKGKREHPNFCSRCYHHGELTYQGENLKEFQKICYDRMRQGGMSKVKAWFLTWAMRFAPRWKKGGIENAPYTYH